MTTMTHQDHYQRGFDAANRALDRQPFSAQDLLVQSEIAEAKHRADENHKLADWNKGFATAIREFLQDKAS